MRQRGPAPARPPASSPRGGDFPNSRADSQPSNFVAILESEERWEELLAKPVGELVLAIDYSCQATHFSLLFEFLLRAAMRSGIQSAPLFQPLEVWRLSPGDLLRFEKSVPDAGRFWSEAFKPSALLAGVARLNAEVAELRIRLQEARHKRSPQWIYLSDGSERGILRQLSGVERAYAEAMRKRGGKAARGRRSFISICSNSWLSQEGSLLDDWIRGRETEIDIGEGKFLDIRFDSEIRMQFTDVCVRFGGTAPVVCESARRIGWRLELFTGQAEAGRFDFVHEVRFKESVAIRHLDAGIDYDRMRLTAITPFVSIVRIEVFGLLSIPEEFLNALQPREG
jgi:hypothetical protein